MPSRSAVIMIGCGMSGVLGAVEIAHEGFEAAVVAHLLGLRLDAAPVGEHDPHAGIEEGELAQAMLERGEVELGLGEGRRRGQEGHLGAGPAGPRRRPPCSGASGSPSLKLISWILPSRQMRSFSHFDSALTTDTPTPCRPPETL